VARGHHFFGRSGLAAWRPRRAAIAGAVLAGSMVAGSSSALASAACDAVNGGGFNAGGSFGLLHTLTGGPIDGFAVGETLTFTITTTGTGTRLGWTLVAGGLTDVATLGVAPAPVTDVVTYTVTGALGDTNLRWSYTATETTDSITVTCAAVGGGAGGSDSDKLRAVQNAATTFAAESSGGAITSATGNAVNDAFANSGNPVSVGANGVTMNFAAEPRPDDARRVDEAFAALGYAGVTKTPAPVQRMWSLWADVRGTGWDRNGATTSMAGSQLNVTAGIGRKVTRDLVVGVFGGYEHFNYDIHSLTATMKGDGGTVGAYAGWRIATALRWDATLAWSHVAYSGSAGTARGSFDGARLLAATGLTGSYQWGAVILEPSARIFALWEDDEAYTDSLGVRQTSRSFSVGRASAGGKLIYPWWVGAVRVAPYAGLYADHRFSSDSALPVGQPVVWIGDGWSARVTGGVAISGAQGGMLSIGGELGGLGADYKVWSVHARVSWPF
jgi:hypothetical protein